MKVAAIISAAVAISGFSAGQAWAWDGYRGSGYDGYGYFYTESRRSYERGYKGEPRFFRGFHDSVDYRPDFHDLYQGDYAPAEGGLYAEDRGYGVEGRGWQFP